MHTHTHTNARKIRVEITRAKKKWIRRRRRNVNRRNYPSRSNICIHAYIYIYIFVHFYSSFIFFSSLSLSSLKASEWEHGCKRMYASCLNSFRLFCRSVVLVLLRIVLFDFIVLLLFFFAFLSLAHSPLLQSCSLLSFDLIQSHLTGDNGSHRMHTYWWQ